MSQPSAAHASLPDQDRVSHSAFDLNVPAVTRWLAQLPRANSGAMTRELFNAIVELNRVRMPAVRRLQLLECIDPVWHDVRDRLQRQHLGRGGLLAEQPRQVARLLESITSSMAVGFSLVAEQSEATTVRDRIESQTRIARAICGSMAAFRYNLLLCSLFYQVPRKGFWRSLHRLYRRAHDEGVALERVAIEGRQLSASDLYASCILFAGAGLNQLHQRDLDGLYRRILDWAPHVELVPGAPQRCLLIVNPDDDAGPVCRSKAAAPTMRWLGLDLRELVRIIDGSLDGPTLPAERTLLLHLSVNWSQAKSRSFKRIESNETLLICIGLDATHRHVAGNEDFEVLTRAAEVASVAQDGGNVFAERQPARQVRSRDIWDTAYDCQAPIVELAHMEQQVRDHRQTPPAERPLPRQHRVETINVSPRGYCLQWPKDSDAPLQSGEVIGVRRDRNDEQWMVGVIRWVRTGSEGAQVGIELLSASAVPWAATVVGRGAPQRVLMLPAMKAIGQAAMLLTPRVPFEERQKVTLARPGEEMFVTLTKQDACSNGFSQFEFREIERLRPALEMQSKMEEQGFDGLWDRL